MQEVFSKIIEELEENQTIVFNLGGGKPKQSIDLERAIEIVKHEAKQYNSGHFGCNTNGEHEKCNGCGLTDCKNRNKIWFGVSDDNNGWIPCSERLPKEYGDYLVAWKPLHMSAEDIIKKVGRAVPHFYEIVEYNPDDEALWIGSIEQAQVEYEIIAWQPLPQPYQPKGE